MSGTSFNVMGNSILKEVLAYGSDAEIRGSVINSNPLFLTDGEKETLSSNKGDWLLMDGTCLMCGVESADSVDAELESLSKFMKKTWNRKIMFVSMRPSTFCACGPSVRPMPGYKPYLGAAEISTKLLNTLNCYIISLPFECISRDGKPYHYIPRIIEYIRSVIDVITVKCDRNAIDKLSLACSIDLRRMICTDVVEKPVSNTAKGFLFSRLRLPYRLRWLFRVGTALCISAPFPFHAGAAGGFHRLSSRRSISPKQLVRWNAICRMADSNRQNALARPFP